MRTRWVALATLLFGCNEAPSEDADGTDTDAGGTAFDTELPSPYADASEGTGAGDVPTMGVGDVVASSLAGLRAFVNLNPAPVVAEFEALIELEEGCPEEFEDIDMDGTRVLYFYTEGCTTSGGLTIQGGGRLEKYTDRAAEGRTSSGALLSAEGGTFRLERGNRWFQFSGYLEYDRGTYAEGETDGYFGFTGEASADSMTANSSALLQGNVTASGSIYGFSGGGFKAVGGSGALTGGGIGPALAMSFDEVLVTNAECATEPAGSLAVRDDAGFWHDVVFDVAVQNADDEYEWDAALCDGCGAYLAGGVADGTACVTPGDLAPLIDWETPPW